MPDYGYNPVDIAASQNTITDQFAQNLKGDITQFGAGVATGIEGAVKKHKSDAQTYSRTLELKNAATKAAETLAEYQKLKGGDSFEKAHAEAGWINPSSIVDEVGPMPGPKDDAQKHADYQKKLADRINIMVSGMSQSVPAAKQKEVFMNLSSGNFDVKGAAEQILAAQGREDTMSAFNKQPTQPGSAPQPIPSQQQPSAPPSPSSQTIGAGTSSEDTTQLESNLSKIPEPPASQAPSPTTAAPTTQPTPSMTPPTPPQQMTIGGKSTTAPAAEAPSEPVSASEAQKRFFGAKGYVNPEIEKMQQLSNEERKVAALEAETAAKGQPKPETDADRIRRERLEIEKKRYELESQKHEDDLSKQEIERLGKEYASSDAEIFKNLQDEDKVLTTLNKKLQDMKYTKSPMGDVQKKDEKSMTEEELNGIQEAQRAVDEQEHKILDLENHRKENRMNYERQKAKAPVRVKFQTGGREAVPTSVETITDGGVGYASGGGTGGGAGGGLELSADDQSMFDQAATPENIQKMIANSVEQSKKMPGTKPITEEIAKQRIIDAIKARRAQAGK